MSDFICLTEAAQYVPSDDPEVEKLLFDESCRKSTECGGEILSFEDGRFVGGWRDGKRLDPEGE